MARPKELRPGDCYFMVSYFDADLRVPRIDTLVYLGTEGTDEDRRWLFQEPSLPNVDDAKRRDDRRVTVFTADQLHMVLSLEALLRTLRERSPHEPRSEGDGPSPHREAGEEWAALDTQIARFLGNPAYPSMTIRLRFTDDGCGIVRVANGGLQLMFFIPARSSTEIEARVRALFAGLGIGAREDYSSDQGGTRNLAFPVPADREQLADTCGRVFRDVYAVQSDDTLEFTFGQ